MLQINNLSRSFGSVQAVDDLSFTTNPGEIFALLGPNGAGKTTTIKLVLGMLRPDNGRIFFKDKEINHSEDNSYKARIGYVPENCALYENLTGLEYLEFISNLHHLDPHKAVSRASRMLDLVDLSDKANSQIRDYSKGMKQKILIISALLHNPELVILDEPFSGLDANAVLLFKELLREQAHQGRTVIFCSHVLEVVERLVDRLLIIDDGKARISGTPVEIIRQTGHETLDRAFNALTGRDDISTQARAMFDTIEDAQSKDTHDER